MLPGWIFWYISGVCGIKAEKLLEITEVCGFENGEIQTRPLYRWEEGKGLVKTGELLHCEKMKRAGIRL